MPSCVFRKCSNHDRKIKKDQGISYHRFPVEKLNRQDWIEIVREQRREPDWIPSYSSRICGIHFKNEDKYISKKGLFLLKKNVVPIRETNAASSGISPPPLKRKRSNSSDTNLGDESSLNEADKIPDEEECATFMKLLCKRLKSLKESTREWAMFEIDQFLYRLKQQDKAGIEATAKLPYVPDREPWKPSDKAECSATQAAQCSIEYDPDLDIKLSPREIPDVEATTSLPHVPNREPCKPSDEAECSAIHAAQCPIKYDPDLEIKLSPREIPLVEATATLPHMPNREPLKPSDEAECSASQAQCSVGYDPDLDIKLSPREIPSTDDNDTD